MNSSSHEHSSNEVPEDRQLLKCPNGHFVPGSAYCPDCGARIQDVDSPLEAQGLISPGARLLHDFEDGGGPVPAHHHVNGGGWVAETAEVAPTAFVGPDAAVFGSARVLDNSIVDNLAWVLGNATVAGTASIIEDAEVSGNARITGSARIEGSAWVSGDAVVEDEAVVGGRARLSASARISGNSRIFPSDADDAVIPRGTGGKSASSPSKLVAGIGFVGIGAIVGGVALLIVGITMHFHNSSLSGICGSNIGQLGQALNPQQQAICNHASQLSLFGVIIAIVGIIGLGWGIKVASGAIGGLALARTESNSLRPRSEQSADREDRSFGEIGSDATVFTCNLCQETFLGWEELAVHTKYVHE